MPHVSISLLTLFGAPAIPYKSIASLLEKAPEIIVWAAPVMFFFVLLEWYIARKQRKAFYEKTETFGSIMVGIGNVFISFLLKFLLFFLVIQVYNLVPWRMQYNWWTVIPCYIIFDFCSYWAHRISHQQRFWWATHIVHHSAEHFNLTVSFRLSWVQHIKLVFFIPVALMGFHPVIFFVVSQVAVLFQFWCHTEYIGKLHPWVEYVFATPSNHRVHHGSQEKYVNKNYASTFVIWDRLFGTYQKEEEQVKYGVTNDIENKANPLHINFHEFAAIFKDVKYAKSWRKKFFYLFGNPIAIAAEKKVKLEKKCCSLAKILVLPAATLPVPNKAGNIYFDRSLRDTINKRCFIGDRQKLRLRRMQESGKSYS